MVWVDGISVINVLFLRYRVKGSDMDMFLIWLSLFDILVMWIFVFCWLGVSDIMIVLVLCIVVFIGGLVGFGVSFVEIFCIGKENEFWYCY